MVMIRLHMLTCSFVDYGIKPTFLGRKTNLSASLKSSLRSSISWFPKFSDARKLSCNLPKLQTKRQKLRVFYQNDADVIANSEDPDQTAPLGAV